MFRKEKKASNKILTDHAVVYCYHTDTGILDIFPRCLIYEQLNVEPKQYYARGISKIIGSENFAPINKNPGEVFARYIKHDILFWLKERNDNEARRIIRLHISNIINQIIVYCIDILKRNRGLNDIMVQTFEGSLSDTDISDQDLQKYLEKYMYRIKDNIMST